MASESKPQTRSDVMMSLIEISNACHRLAQWDLKKSEAIGRMDRAVVLAGVGMLTLYAADGTQPLIKRVQALDLAMEKMRDYLNAAPAWLKIKKGIEEQTKRLVWQDPEGLKVR